LGATTLVDQGAVGWAFLASAFDTALELEES